MNQEKIIQRYANLLSQETYNVQYLLVRIEELEAENVRLNKEIEEYKKNNEEIENGK